MHPSLASVYAKRRPWHLVLFTTVVTSLLIGAAGVVLKSKIVEMLPAAHEAAGAPTGILRFLDNGIDSWKPMMLATTVFHSPEGDRLFEALRDFQRSGSAGRAGDLSFFSDSTKFQYPLTSLLPVEFLDKIGLGSIRVFNIINLCMFLVCLGTIGYLAVQPLTPAVSAGTHMPVEPADNARNGIYAAGLAVLVGLTFYPAFMSLVKGNIQLWINCLFALACLSWVRGREFQAGLFIALATAIKPQLGALLLWALLWRRWSFCKGFLIAGVPIALTAILYFGWHNNLAYLDTLATISKHGERFVFNESINGIVHRLVEGDGTAFLLWENNYAPYRPIVHVITFIFAAVFALAAFLPALLRRGEEPTIFDFAFAAICLTIGSPIVWIFHYGILLPIFVITLKAILDQPESAVKTRLLIALAASWLLCATYLPLLRLVSTSPWNVAANPRFFGAIILLCILAYVGRIWRGHLVGGLRIDAVLRGLGSKAAEAVRRSRVSG